MDKLIIRGRIKLKGTVEVSGSKNSALPILAATLLTDESCILHNVPRLNDIDTMCEILGALGVKVTRKGSTLMTKVVNAKRCMAPYGLVRKMRASISVLGPLLAKRKRALVSYPGGCVIGVRPIDLHLKGLRAIGADIQIRHGYLDAKAKKLKGALIYLGGQFGSTALGTCNVMSAAALASGTTVIEDAACEPEVQDLAYFLTEMGARIQGIGTKRLIIEGVDRLSGAEHTVVPDRIEAGTFMVAAAITRGDLTIRNVRPDHLGAVIDILQRIGVKIRTTKDSCRVWAGNSFSPVDFATLPYPGIPTDMQPQLMTLLCTVKGTSIITEKIFPDRFMHVQELSRLGANIRKEGSSAIVVGVDGLSGAEVMASDLRAGAALVLAGLAASGKTTVKRVYHIDRGYEHIEKKLRAIRADITRRVDTAGDSYVP